MKFAEEFIDCLEFTREFIYLSVKGDHQLVWYKL
jgi:hypothetical protein